MLFIICLLPSIFWGQKKTSYTLVIKGASKIENTQLVALNYPTSFNSKKLLLKTKDSIRQVLKESGYIALTQDSLKRNDHEFTAYLSLGSKIQIAHVHIASRDIPFMKTLDYTMEGNKLMVPITNIKQTLEAIHEALINRGEAFSKVYLSQITTTSKKLKATLTIERGKRRTIDKFIVKGYPEFPKSFLKHYFQSSTKQLLTPKTLEALSQKSQQLAFVKERKTPEILFTKDSTIVYLFLAQKKNNSFDGFVNFSTENKKIQLRGAIDLALHNAFHGGEQFQMNWTNINKKKALNLVASIPYIFNTKITPRIAFNLFKNDSLYNNTKATLNIAHPISKNISAQLLAGQETSSINKTTGNAQSFEKTSFGLGFLYTSQNQRLTTNTTLTRNTRITTNQRVTYQLDAIITSTFQLSNKLSLVLNNITQLTSNNSTLENELFRSGGMMSIRGYQENTILSNSYSLIQSTLKFFTTDKTSLYTIQDIGLFQLLQKNEVLSSLGIGYEFQRQNNKFNIGYILNTSKEQNAFKSALISITMRTVF